MLQRDGFAVAQGSLGLQIRCTVTDEGPAGGAVRLSGPRCAREKMGKRMEKSPKMRKQKKKRKKNKKLYNRIGGSFPRFTFTPFPFDKGKGITASAITTTKPRRLHLHRKGHQQRPAMASARVTARGNILSHN